MAELAFGPDRSPPQIAAHRCLTAVAYCAFAPLTSRAQTTKASPASAQKKVLPQKKYDVTGSWRGCVANCIGAELNMRCFLISCSNTEEGVDEFALPDRVTFRQPTNLSFSNHMHRFITFDRSPG